MRPNVTLVNYKKFAIVNFATGRIKMTNNMGDRIRELRKRKGLTLDQLATNAGSSKSYIWELENKNPPRPSADKLSAIAEALDTTLDHLMGTSFNSEDDLSPEDRVFFRKFVSLDPKKKDKMRQTLDLWDDE